VKRLRLACHYSKSGEHDDFLRLTRRPRFKEIHMNYSDVNRIAEALNLTAAQKVGLDAILTARAAPKSPTTIPGASKVALNIHLTEGTSLRHGAKGTSGQKGIDDATGEVFKELPAELRKTLIEIEPQVLRWIRTGDDNAARFATDPLGALKDAVPGLDPKALASLASIRGRHARQTGNIDGVDLVSIRLDAKPVAQGKEKK